MSSLYKRCSRCKDNFLLTEMAKYKNGLYCPKCAIIVRSKNKSPIIDGPLETMIKSTGIPQETVDISKVLKDVTSLGDIIGHDLVKKVFQSNQLTAQEKNDAYIELEKNLSKQMLTQALGYTYNEEETTFVKVPESKSCSSEWIEYKKKITKKHQPGNSQIFIMFLTNKYPDLWKVSKELIHSKSEGYDSEPSQRDRKKVIALARQILESDTDNPKG